MKNEMGWNIEKRLDWYYSTVSSNDVVARVNAILATKYQDVKVHPELMRLCLVEDDLTRHLPHLSGTVFADVVATCRKVAQELWDASWISR